MKKMVFISHPCAGNIEGNRKKVDTICKEIMKKHDNVLPISPLHMFSYIENDNDRDYILDACYQMIDMCAELWSYGSSEGCDSEVYYAHKAGVKVVYKCLN
jgi:hypothetical protein